VIELHCHTTVSDGTLTPGELVELAASLGITHLAITDHDSTGGVKEAARACGSRDIVLIPGVEMSATYQERPMDLLGYGIDPDDPALSAALADMVRRRADRLGEMLRGLRSAGIELEEDEVIQLAAGGVVGRPHVAQALVRRGVVSSVAEAFDHYLGRGRPGYVPKENFTPEEAIELITGAGGVAVLAHPRYLKLDDDQFRALLDRLMDAGLAGIEVYYSQHTAEDVARFERFARQRGLLATGGSDFHGANKPEIRLGIGALGRPLDETMAEALLERIAAARHKKAGG